MKISKNNRFNLRYVYLCISLIFILFSVLLACKKEKGILPPTLNFVSETGFTSADRIVAIGYPTKIGIVSKAGSAPITNLVITLTNDYGTEVALDTAVYTENLEFVKTISFGSSSFETWTFTVIDKNRIKSILSITLTKDPNSMFGPIYYYPSIKIGFQKNMAIGSFIATSTIAHYFADSAMLNQNKVNMIAYYGSLNIPPTWVTLSSPAEADAPNYFQQLLNWALPKNEIRYKADSTSISTAAFDAAYNDSIILSNYTSATMGKRKFKMARPNYVIPFMITIGTDVGKRGIIKIISCNYSENGWVEFALKIQK